MRKSAIYDNCELYSPDDIFLGYIPRHRLDWYVSKDIADKISENKIKLKFQPKHKKTDDLILKEKELPKKNICVICGKDDLSLLRKFWIIPHDFKKCFPEEIKSKKADDVVPICNEHASDADCFVEYIKDKTFKKYSIDPAQFKEDPNVIKIKNTLKKILKNGFIEKH